jgi:hypothetical protein
VDPDKGSAKWIADECILEVCVLVRERKRDKQTADRQRQGQRERQRKIEISYSHPQHGRHSTKAGS